MASKPTPAQTRLLALLTQEGAWLKDGGFAVGSVLMNGHKHMQSVNSATASVLKGASWVEAPDWQASTKLLITDKGREALVDAMLGEKTGARFSLVIQRARMLEQLTASLIQTRGRAGRCAVVFEDEAPESMLRDLEARAQSYEEQVAAVWQGYLAEMLDTLKDASFVAGVGPEPEKKSEAQP